MHLQKLVIYGKMIKELILGGNVMETFKKFIFGAALYTTALATLFYLFALISGMTDSVMGISKYFTILLFGAIISASALIFDTKLHVFLKYAINYVVLLLAFCTVFLSSATGAENQIARACAAIFIFTLLYALVLILRYFFIAIITGRRKKRGKQK